MQRFLRCLDIIHFIKNLSMKTNILEENIKKGNNPLPWTNKEIKVIRKIKEEVQNLFCLGILNPVA